MKIAISSGNGWKDETKDKRHVSDEDRCCHALHVPSLIKAKGSHSSRLRVNCSSSMVLVNAMCFAQGAHSGNQREILRNQREILRNFCRSGCYDKILLILATT